MGERQHLLRWELNVLVERDLVATGLIAKVRLAYAIDTHRVRSSIGDLGLDLDEELSRELNSGLGTHWRVLPAISDPQVRFDTTRASNVGAPLTGRHLVPTLVKWVVTMHPIDSQSDNYCADEENSP